MIDKNTDLQDATEPAITCSECYPQFILDACCGGRMFWYKTRYIVSLIVSPSALEEWLLVKLIEKEADTLDFKVGDTVLLDGKEKGKLIHVSDVNAQIVLEDYDYSDNPAYQYHNVNPNRLTHIPVYENFEIGDKAVIIDCKNEHEFDICSIVELIEYIGSCWLAKNEKGEVWYVTEEEIRKYQKYEDFY